MTPFKANIITALILILLGRSILGIEAGVEIPSDNGLRWDELALGIGLLIGGATYAIAACIIKIKAWL